MSAHTLRGFARVSAAVPECRPADVVGNVLHTLALFERSHEQGDALVVFPELGISGYTARDLFADQHLLAGAVAGLRRVVDASKAFAPLALVGLPVLRGDRLYNAAAAVQRGKLLGVVPKAYLPNYREFEEARWFRPGAEVEPGSTIDLLGVTVPFGLDLLFASGPLVVGVELCEDYFVHIPPSAFAVSAGANVICNLSASNFTVGKAELRRLLARSASDRGKCAYIYVAAGPGESSTDLAFDADAFICENGRVLAESQRFARTGQLVTVDVDLELLARERIVTTSFGDCSRENEREFTRIEFEAPTQVHAPLLREVARHPFVPSEPRTLAARCWEIFEIQTNALATRMASLGRPKLVLGVSGGLDSSHAALVAAAALDLQAQPRTDLHCVTMPGLGTTDGTKSNAVRLAEALGATLKTLPVSAMSQEVLGLVGHGAAAGVSSEAELRERLASDPNLGDITLENVQARLRTLVLMTVANQVGGLVVGTGDLSEKALGWATYAGDHIAMYDVNAGVPKTLIQFVIRWVANERVGTWSVGDPGELREVLFSILDTPISPELLPATADGSIAQLTEEAIGPYELHDFFLYHVVRHGARPGRVLDLARVAFDDKDLPTLKRWFAVFLRRFFASQFKRSCTADAPKVGQVALSPRGDWRMPSDAEVASWLAEVDAYES